MLRALFLSLLLLVPTGASAVTIHDEGVDGDLSGVLGSPDSLSFSTGANTVIGGVGTNGGTGATNGSDADYFTVVVPIGSVISSITVDAYSVVGLSAGNRSFFGTVAAAAFTGQGPGDVDAFTLINATSGDVVAALGGPLGSGSHSFWLQETAAGTAAYTLTFTLVPEPGLAALLGLGLLVGRRFSRRA